MAAPKRFFVDRISEEVVLTGDELRHAKNVLRLSEGDEVTLLDGSGREYAAVIARCARDEYLLHVLSERANAREPQADVCLLFGALKGDKNELVVQKAVELGVRRIGIFSSRYCAAYLNENKLARLDRVAHEAAKQCLRARVPEIAYYGELASALASAQAYEHKLFACEFLEASEQRLPDAPSSVALVVGSEGGFMREEYELARQAGFCGVSLGRRILRAETASIALLSVVMYLAGELR